MKRTCVLAILITVFSSPFIPADAQTLPDFVITSVSGPASSAPGDTVYVTVQARNQGQTPSQTGTNVILRMILSPDQTIDLSDTYYAEYSVPIASWSAGATVQQTFSFPLATGISGTYYWGAYVDSALYWTESNENNNFLLGNSVQIQSPVTQEWSYDIPAGEQQVPIGGTKSFYVPVTGAPADAVITNVEAKFDYVANLGAQSYVSARFNRAFDSNTYGVVLVNQGALPEGNPGTLGYLSYPTQFDNTAVNTNYFFRFSLASSSPSTAAIQKIYVRITYIIPAYVYQWAEVVSRNSPDGWSLNTDVGVTGVSGYPEYAWSSDGSTFSNYLPMTSFYNWGATSTFYERRVTNDYSLSPIQFNGATFSWRFTNPVGAVETRARVSTIRQLGLFESFELLSGGVNPVVSWRNGDPGINYWRIRVFDSAYNLLWQTNLSYSGEEITYTFNSFNFTPGMEYIIRIEAREYSVPLEYVSGTIPNSTSNIYMFNRSHVDMRLNTNTTPATLDSDGDGMPDTYEIEYGLNRWVNDAAADADGDGFSNVREYLSGSDPNYSRSTPAILFDFDNDGDVDGKDLATLASEMGRSNCATATPCAADLNGDGKVDAKDLTFFTSDFSRRKDTDGDGIPDDGDNSGVIGDNPCTGGIVADCDDNCVNTPNPTQTDSNGDGIGDVCAAPDAGILTNEELSYLTPAERGEIYLLTGPDLIDKGLDNIKSREILKAKSYFKVAASKYEGVNTNTAHTAWFFKALTRVSSLAFDSETDGVEDGLLDIGDVLDRAGYTTDPAQRDLFNYETMVRPATLAANSPSGSEMQEFAYTIALPEFQGALDDLDKVPQSFNARWVEPLDSTSVESDYGDVLAFRSALKSSIAAILIQYAHDFDTNIDQEYNDYYGPGNTAEDFLARNFNFGNLAALNHLTSSKAYVDSAATDALSAINWIQAETDAQADDYVSLKNATPEEINDAKNKITAFKQSLYGPSTIDDRNTPTDTSDDTVIDSSPAFTGLDLVEFPAVFPRQRTIRLPA